jgi:hypothetical protein
VRLERFCKAISGCHLAVEAIHRRASSGMVDALDTRRAGPDAAPNHLLFDVRLDLILRTGELVPLEHQQGADADGAVRAAFDAAERMLARGAARI